MVEALPMGVTSLDGAGILSPGELEEVLAAFRGYEAALMANDLDALDAYFAPGPSTLRGDAAGLLVGHDRISSFRGLRGGVAARTIVEVHVRVLSATSVLVVSVSAFAAGGRGLQTQLWQRAAPASAATARGSASTADAPEGGASAGARAADGVAAPRAGVRADEDAPAWVIAAAHVTGAAPAVNRSVWRVVGAPLVPPSARGAGADGAGVARGAGADGAESTRGEPEAPTRSSEGGALAGTSVAVKDVYAVAGFAVGAGVPEFLAEGIAAEVDADAVVALRSAGAAVQGIAQTDEFAYSIAGRNVHFGAPPNPAVPGAIPGGSSSGPAAAVALGQATIGLATDTAGSIRVPASYQGLWGIRTTHGAVSTRGLLPLAPSFDTVGWLTRSPSVLRAAAAASFAGAPGPTPADPSASRSVVGARFVVSADLVASCDEPVQAAFGALVAHPVFGDVESVELGDLDGVFAAFRTVQGAEAWRVHGEWVAAHPGVLGADIAERFEVASRITAVEEADARTRLAEARARLDAVLGGRILLLPSASSAAPALDAPAELIAATRAATLRMTAVAGTGGYPAVSAPLLSVPAPGGAAPVGLCFVGERGADLSLIDLAAAVAEALAAE